MMMEPIALLGSMGWLVEMYLYFKYLLWQQVAVALINRPG